MKTIDEAAKECISKIHVNKANFDYISTSGKINGSLYLDLNILAKQMVEFAQRWIPVDEELPGNGNNCLTRCVGGSVLYRFLQSC